MLWSILTSDTVLGLTGIVAVACFVVGFFPLASLIPFLSPYVIAARFVGVGVLAWLMFCLGHRSADNTAALRQARIDLAFSQVQLETQKATAEQAAKLREQAEAQAQQLNERVSAYEAQLAKRPDAGCNLDDSDVTGLRNIAR